MPPAGGRSGGLTPGSVVATKFRLLGERQTDGDQLAFKALHVGTGRRVELRLLPEGIAADSPEAERMLRAARAAGRAPHPNLLNVVDSGLDAGYGPYVVYEQFGGVAASELLERSGPCDLRLASDILSQVLDGLSALHARGLYHRQIRPEHVLVDGGVDDVRVKLIGLGYSAHPAREAEPPELPRGYSRYLAPELRRGAATGAPAVDIYAAGVLLRFLLTGDAAPQRELSDAVERAVARATAEDPDERFQTAEQFRACVRAIAGSPVRESILPPGSLPADLRFMLQRRRSAEEEGDDAQPEPARGGGRVELYPALLVIESLYARIGASGWNAIRAALPEVEQLLPGAGLAAQHRQYGVPAALLQSLLGHADRLSGRGNLRLVAELGEDLARRGLGRFCAALPAQLTPECLVACVPVLWRSICRDGEVVTMEQLGGAARLGVRAQQNPSLELTALFAGILRGQLRLLTADGELNWLAAQALGDGADVYLLSW